MIFGKHVNKFYKKYFWYFFFGILALISVDIIQTYIPRLTGHIVDGISNGDIKNGTWGYLITQVGWICLIGVGMFVGRFAWRRCIFGESVRIQADIRYDMFKKTEILSQRYFKENKTGAILSYYSNDLETVEEAFGFGIVQLVDGIFLLLISLVKMLRLQPVLTLILLIPLAVLGICAYFVDKLMEIKYDKKQKAFERMSDFAQENFTGIRVIKAFVKEKKELRQFKKRANDDKNTNVSFTRTDAILEVAFDILIYLVFGVILIGGSYLVYVNINDINKGITVGQLVEFVGYADTLIWPVFALAGVINLLARARTSMRRISTLLDEKVDIVDNEVVCPTDLKGEIEFKNFNFAFPDDPKRKVLENINLKIKNGETVGVVGKIGSGKSTLVNMLFRLYNVEENSLFVSGYDIMHLPVKMVRDLIGYCPQDNFLFSNTIKSNIAFSNPKDTQDQIEEAARFADVETNIEEFPDKYDTMIGEKGVTLSGGQKQRISIARAMIKNPTILVLDDSVSAVDVKTEETILHNIKSQRKGKTTIVIASRVSTVMSLDKIIVMNDGKLEAFGNHEECLAKSKIYARMVELQSLEKELEGKK